MVSLHVSKLPPSHQKPFWITTDLLLGNKLVVVKDPDSIEHILRAEGKYPVRDPTDGMYWLIKNVAKELPTFSLR